MIDAITRERIVIITEGTSGPYLMVAQEQLDTVTTALKAGNIDLWVDEEVISIDDDPPVAVINLARGTDVTAVQQILDAI